MSAVPRRRLACDESRQIAAVGLGTAALGVVYGAPASERPPPGEGVVVELVRDALDLGVDVFDTAPAYGDAEALLGRALGGRQAFVATKLAIPTQGWSSLSDDELNTAVSASVDASLHRLGRDRVDLVQVHNADLALVADGRLAAALREVVEDGRAALTGATVYEQDAALAAVRLGSFDTVQVAYNVLDRRPELELLDAAEEAGVAVFTRSTLLRGVLSPAGRSLPARLGALRAAVDRIRDAAGVSWEDLSGLALAFALAEPRIASVLVGARDSSELRALLDGAARLADAGRALRELRVEVPPALLDPRAWDAG